QFQLTDGRQLAGQVPTFVRYISKLDNNLIIEACQGPRSKKPQRDDSLRRGCAIWAAQQLVLAPIRHCQFSPSKCAPKTRVRANPISMRASGTRLSRVMVITSSAPSVRNLTLERINGARFSTQAASGPSTISAFRLTLNALNGTSVSETNRSNGP